LDADLAHRWVIIACRFTPWDVIVSENSKVTDGQRSRLAHESSALVEQDLITKSGRRIPVEIDIHLFENDGQTFALSIARDISDKKKIEEELRELRGILPLCSFCNKIRDDKGYWERVDVYIQKHSKADISHSICPDCMKRHYPKQYERIQSKKNKGVRHQE
jgi:hypothetical protein